MSAWSSQSSRLASSRRGFGERGRVALSISGLALFLGATLLVRVLTDDQSSPDSRYSGSLNLSGVIAVLFIVVAIGLLLRRRHGVLPAVLASLWLCVWTAVAVSTHGASTETLRDGIREGSVVALAVIVYNARDAVTVSTATRLVQFIAFAPALVALYQLATHSGMDVEGELRANGTFAHPDLAAMFFAIATSVSLWRYLDSGRRRSDALLTALFAAAVIATFSIDGLITLVAMLATLSVLRPGSLRVKMIPVAIASVIILVFLATPLGTQRVAKESATSLATAERGEANSSLAWRLHKWQSLIPEWERSPIIGQGLGTTTTTESTLGHHLASELPHNEYIRYLVETGIIGLTILVCALAMLIQRLFCARKRLIFGAVGIHTPNPPTLAIIIIVGCLVNALADNTFLESPTCYAAALIIFAVMASNLDTTRIANRLA
jgi:O-antigen ligase